jgi:hypothetical protein
VITLAFCDGHTLTVRADYAHREEIKALASYPDIRWHPESKSWLLDARLFDKLSERLGHEFAPLTMGLLEALPPRDDCKRMTQGMVTKGRVTRRRGRKAG